MASPSPAESAVPAGPLAPVPFPVVARRRETADTWTLELRGPDGGGLAFAPGQFTMLAAGGAGEVPISISGDPSDGGRLVHTVRAVGLATAAICESVPGRVLSVRGPFGTPWPVDALDGGDVVVVAGGIGLAPLRPAILRLLEQRERFGRLTLLYGGRSPEQLLYGDEPAAWRRRGLEVAVTVDAATPGWHGTVGIVTRLVERAAIDGPQTTALLCGPEIMMRFVTSALARRGVAPARTWVSLERNMQCGIGVCGHCQLGPTLICRDGPVYRLDAVAPWLAVREL